MYVNAKHALLVFFSIVLMVAGLGDVARSQIDGGRAMLPEDLLTLQTIKETVFSPDGRWAAIVVERPKKAGESYERGYLGGLDRSDIWLASTDGKSVANVTRGEAVHAGYWNPVWSPDSKRLAMASTRGSDNVRAYIYDLNTQHLRACATEGLDLALRIEDPESNASTMVWLGPNHLLLGLLPPGTRPLAMDENERALGVSVKAMADVKRGRDVTASILDTERVELPASQRKNVALTVVDVATNKARVLTRIPLIETRLSQRVVSISPDRRYGAILATDYPNPVSHDRWPRANDVSPLRIGVANLTKADSEPIWVENVCPASFGLGVMPTSIRWAPSVSTFAFIGAAAGDPVPTVFTVKSEQNRAEAVRAIKGDQSGDDAVLLTAEDIQWAATGELLVYGYTGSLAGIRAEVSLKDVRGFSRDNNQETVKREWWIVSSPNSYHKLTPDLAQSPRVLFKTQNSSVMLGASGGQVWTIDPGSRTATAFKATRSAPSSPPSSIIWPRPADAHRPIDHLIVSQSTTSGSDLFRLDLSGSAPVKIGTMPRGARFSDYSPQQQLCAYETEITELRVIAGNRTQPITLVSLNRQLDAIAKPQYRTIQYQTAEGKQLPGALLLPYGYVAGRRYPLLVSVYGGTLAPSSRDWANPYEWRTRYYPDPLVLAGHGYAVLVPSIPLPPIGVQSDPMLELDKSVKPAVEKVVEMGFADPDRVGVVGYSYGGYGVYGLITQTERFKAAVAIVGATDLLSDYGRLDPRHRFSDVPNFLWGPFNLEAHQMRMGVPPWKDLDRYLRNSPYVHVDKVTTPLLMIHGELDTHPLSEPEKFFVALNRQGKRAKLVRYLAEGHSIDSPGNILDMYKQMLNWFDEYLQNGQSNQSAKTK